VTSRYGRQLEFGLFPVPNADDLEVVRSLARRADELGLDLIGIQDHPYQWRYLETWALIADLVARTERVRLFPDVANLPLRGPAMIAKHAATLDVLSGGRFELGLGAGAFWEPIAAMGGPVRSPREALESLEEAIEIIRLFWSGERSIAFEGKHYRVKGLHPGPAPGAPDRDLARSGEAALARPSGPSR
jgi:alkanesulfonate monooxygenase SsuD/methylene tetrahydromethanopterin reductase-like flavin-dependent oxidoreductase (luciferase family)